MEFNGTYIERVKRKDTLLFLYSSIKTSLEKLPLIAELL